MKRLLDVWEERETPVEFITGVLSNVIDGIMAVAIGLVVMMVFGAALVGWWTTT